MDGSFRTNYLQFRRLNPCLSSIFLAVLVPFWITSFVFFPTSVNCYLRFTLTERRGGLVVSVPASGSRGPGSSPGRVIVLCSWARHFILTLPLSTQEYKWVPANCQGNLTKCWRVTCDGLASHSGGVAILLVAYCYGNRDKLRLCGPLASCADGTFFLHGKI